MQDTLVYCSRFYARVLILIALLYFQCFELQNLMVLVDEHKILDLGFSFNKS